MTVQVPRTSLCLRVRMTSLRDGLLLYGFPHASELDEVVAYLRSHDFMFLEDLVGAPSLGTDTHMFMISAAAFEFVDGVVRALTDNFRKDTRALVLSRALKSSRQKRIRWNYMVHRRLLVR